MALVLKDRVKQTAAAPGTGTITLSGSVTGFQSFSAIGNGNITYYTISDSVSGDWEVNYGVYTASGTTLTRNATPLSSSTGGTLVNFTGAVDVFVTYPSENAVWRDTAGVVAQQSFGAITATSAALTTGTISTAPVNNTDIVNKAYADAIASGINFHEAVALATTAALPANTYNNGTSGVGATLTGNANGALSVDSTLTIAAERILVKNEVAGANNGVYVVTQVGSAGTPYILTRATDFNSVGTGVNQIDEGDFFLVTSGVANLNTAWVQQTDPPITIGTTPLVFQQFSAPITYTAGTGLSESPSYTFNIANTGTAGTYGSASQVPVFVTNAQGQVTSVTNTSIAISGSAVSGNISGQAGSVANALTAGTYLTSGGTFDGSAARTFAVDATSANTASKVVARDASGDFSAGTITATLSGAATSATTATNIAGGAANQLPYQTGAATTSFITAPTVASTFLNWTGSAFAWSAISTPNAVTFNNGGAGDGSGIAFNGSAARTISYNTVGASPLAGSSNLTTTGTVTSGTWSASFGAVSGANLTSLTAGNLSGTIPSAVLGNSTAYVGTTAIALNRASANQALTGISSITLPGSTSGTAQIMPSAVAGTGTVLTLPATTGTLALTSNIPTVNNATLTMNTSGTGLSGSQTFTANQATGATFTVNSNATNANTASTIVARDASGNFSAGTITATLSGQASSVANSHSAGTYLTGSAYNGSAAQTWAVDATSANTASKVVARDASGNFSAGTITATLSGNATNVTGTVAVANGGTGQTTGYKLFEATYTSSIDANVNRTAGMYGSYGAAATNTPTASGILYHFLSGTGGAGDGGQFWQDYVSNNLYLRQRWGGTYGSWLTILSASNYNSYSPTLTGTGASGNWSINAAALQGLTTGASGSIYTDVNWSYLIQGFTTGGAFGWRATSATSVAFSCTAAGAFSATTYNGFTPSATSGTANRLVATDANGYIFNNYFNSTDNAISSGVTAIMSKQGDNYYRSASAAAVATFISGQAFNTTGTATGLNGSNYITSTGSSGNYNTDFQNTPAYTLRYNGDSASATNNPGGTWWFIQNMRHSNSGNYWGTQIAWGWEDNANKLATRNVSGGSFGSWVYYLNSSNYNSYAPTLTGGGASGTWGIAITGNAGNTSSISNAVGGSYTWTSQNYFVSNQNTTGSGPALQAYSNNASGAIMSFHRGGAFAINMGLDSDNVIRIGGWSASANRLQMDMSGNLTMAGNVTAYSDERLKKDWALLPDDFIEQLAKVKSGTYTRIDSEERQVGVSAQGLQKFLDEAVQTDAEGMLSVNYGGSALAACVELAKRIVEQDAKIARLEALVSKLIGD